MAYTYEDYKKMYAEKKRTLQECLDMIQSGDHICFGKDCNEPLLFCQQLHTVAHRVEDVTVLKGRSSDFGFLQNADVAGHIMTQSAFFSKGWQRPLELGTCTFVPNDLHDQPIWYNGANPRNTYIAAVTPMDENGNFQIPYCQMFEREALACAKTVILEINPRFRRVRGGVEIPIERVTCCYTADSPILTIPRSKPSPTDETIGAYIADMIHDGDTFQLGIGGLPDAVGKHLFARNDLGIHSELFSSTMADLIEQGNVTGRYKTVDPGESIACFALGDDHLYKTLSETPSCRIMPASYTNDPFIIAQQDHMISVNTALEMDLTGQICSESIGPVQWSGTGGASDFAFGALHSKGGRGIIAFSSTAKGGTISRIKVMLTPGAAVSISRNLADTIVTEYGVAELRGRSIRERADALIAIAHPDFRAELREGARKLGYL